MSKEKQLDQQANTKKAGLERQKLRTAKNKLFRATRNEGRRKAIALRRAKEGWEIVGSASDGFRIHHCATGNVVRIDDEPEWFDTYSAAYNAARAAGQPAKLIR